MFFTAVIQIIQNTIDNLFEEYKAMMRNLSYSILKDHQYAEDAVQESLLILAGNMDKIDNLHSNRSKNYIYTVTKNEAIALYKKIKNKNEKVVQFFDEEEVNNIEGEIDVKAFCNEYGFSEEMLEALSKIEEIDKDILIYKYGAGYSVKEIAKLIGRTPDFVYKRMQRAMKKLQKIIEGDKR